VSTQSQRAAHHVRRRTGVSDCDSVRHTTDPTVTSKTYTTSQILTQRTKTAPWQHSLPHFTAETVSHAMQVGYQHRGKKSINEWRKESSPITIIIIITGPPNGPVLFCTLSSVAIVCRLSSSVTHVGGRPSPGQAHGQSSGRHCMAGQYGYVHLGRHLVDVIRNVFYVL